MKWVSMAITLLYDVKSSYHEPDERATRSGVNAIIHSLDIITRFILLLSRQPIRLLRPFNLKLSVKSKKEVGTKPTPELKRPVKFYDE